ncbi:hypothetical protein LT85_2230 [Collimonas arenae]|uniref:Uncharacterized protein n=1 Tax=Collimonas arenae TaxID=279058 RepID=A0A0A1F9H2_9BURK|nr:hypothetical protein LT85_2230 [Collimonas arenae]
MSQEGKRRHKIDSVLVKTRIAVLPVDPLRDEANQDLLKAC